MTGSSEDWPRDGLGVGGMDSGLWVAGLDYVQGWREAREVADRLNRAFLGVGFELSELRAVASTNEEARGVVRVVGWPGAVNRLAALLEALADGDGGVR
ncbi:hypothetical protein OG824_17930 [Streptomyces prunicolor]|uniref:hypothetical protein n=1 Tax=Streptomyces prunicolor TaxID=67348 RepID=UPI00225892CF|nr:hypothetical protein [Streptomyces prunicolor]MCX5237078.1 hypothetical protein [Streptomyces prunicolor]